jgi:LPXTG-site transpeptidase (sortase) family protein
MLAATAGTAAGSVSTPPASGGWPTPTLAAAVPAELITPTANPAGDWPLPDHVDVAYWLSIPAIGVEAPVIALAPRQYEVDGRLVLRLPVPNSYSVAWDSTSAEPGFSGNVILTGHHNVYGGVFRQLHELTVGTEIALWSEYGVFSYYISEMIYLEEEDQPFSVRAGHAQWLGQTADTRVTLITCWPHSTSTHRLIVVALR